MTLTRASDRRGWAEDARTVLDPEEYVNSGIEYAEVLAEAVEALLADRKELVRQLRGVRAKNRELRTGPRIVGEPGVHVVPHDGGPAILFADLGDAERYAELRGEGWESEYAEVLDRTSAAALITEEERRH